MKRPRPDNAINASSMADIAFLLLIFFLVTTTIDIDKGILQVLPPIAEEPPPTPRHKRNTMQVLVSQNNQLLINGQPAEVDKLRQLAKDFIDNPDENILLAESPNMAMISLQHDAGTSYWLYIAVQNELKAAYRELRDTYAMQHFGHNFGTLRKVDPDAAQQVTSHYPMRLVEPEPYAAR